MHQFDLFSAQSAVEKRRALLVKNHYSKKLFAQDPQLWSESFDAQKQISNCLGWISVPHLMKSEKLSEIKDLSQAVRQAGYDTLVCLGMGGSSLAPLVFGDSFPHAKQLRLFVLDTTDPKALGTVEVLLNFEKTLFVTASKSGSTIESNSLHDYFYAKLEQQLGSAAGAHFVAITDDKTSLVDLARRQNFRHVFLNPSNIGGRFSALSFFGLVIAGLIGVDLDKVLARALHFNEDIGLYLGAALAELALQGRDKITLIADPPLRTFSLWVEQLVAESSGKNGQGLVPVSDEPLFPADHYSNDRLFVRLALKGAQDPERARLSADLRALKIPVIEIEISQPEDLGHEFFLWEYATALVGHILQFNPFDQPDVQSSKEHTARVLKEKPEKKIQSSENSLLPLLNSAKPKDYVALMAFVAETKSTDQLFQEIRKTLTEKWKLPTTFGYGPRFLHSTGQLHKGGPNTALCIQFTCDYEKDLPIPGKAYSFGDLIHAQAQGDFTALQKKERRLASLPLGSDVETSLRKILKDLRA